MEHFTVKKSSCQCSLVAKTTVTETLSKFLKPSLIYWPGQSSSTVYLTINCFYLRLALNTEWVACCDSVNVTHSRNAKFIDIDKETVINVSICRSWPTPYQIGASQ